MERSRHRKFAVFHLLVLIGAPAIGLAQLSTVSGCHSSPADAPPPQIGIESGASPGSDSCREPAFSPFGEPAGRVLAGPAQLSPSASTLAVASPLQGPEKPGKRLRVVIFGGHPDDPESGAGGLAAMLTRQGHEVIFAYGTTFRGGRQFFERPEGDVRREEARAACEILGATAKFFPYAHEKLVADEPTEKDVSAWLDEVKPDILVTHWPLDTHPNHHVVSSLVWQCYKRKGGWNLYFFEVMTDQQTIAFRPELYLDIEPVREVKRRALMEHRSQKPEAIWADHEKMHRRRGSECGVAFAEAYSLVEAKEGCPLLPVSFRPRIVGHRAPGAE